jgi:tRNA (cytidine/uridine-2'-O-)-methyltransferase
MVMLNIVLYQPEIPHNTGAVGRLCLATGARLHLIKPLGFSLEDKYLKRSGLDYWAEVQVQVWDSWEQMRDHAGPKAHFMFIECQGAGTYWQADLQSPEELYLVYGPETSGIPTQLMGQYPDQTWHIPMQGTRSLNLSTAVAIVLYEAVRQRSLTT